VNRPVAPYLLTLAVSACAAFSPAAGAADLAEVYRDAVFNDSAYASARAARAVSMEKPPTALAGLLPTVNATTFTQSNGATIRQRLPNADWFDRDFNSHGWTVSLNQPLINLPNWEQYKQAELAVVQAEAVFADSAQQLILRVVQAYFDVLAAQDDLATLGAQKEALSEQLVLAKRSFALGKATITDLYDAQSHYDLTVSQEVGAKNTVESKRRALKLITNKYPDALTPLKPSLRLNSPVPEVIEEWVARAEKQNFTVRAKEAAVEIAVREVAQQRDGHFPTLSLFANRGRTSSGNSTTTFVGSDVYSQVVGVQLTIPLYAGGSIESQTRSAIASLEQARQDLETARRTAAQGAAQAFLDETGGISQVSALETALKSSEQALDANKKGYSVGVRINNDVLTAVQQLFGARRDLSKARYDAIVNGLKLKASVGTLLEEDVEEINRVALDH
jgi:outer membrane protein